MGPFPGVISPDPITSRHRRYWTPLRMSTVGGTSLLSRVLHLCFSRKNVLNLPVRGGRYIAPGQFYVPFSERFDEEGNRRPLPHPETPKFRDELPPPTNPKIADKRPFRMICEPKKIYWWCSCGQSKEQPFCDGHHAKHLHPWPNRNDRNMFKPIKVVFPKKTEVWWCRCKQTSSPPFCDGSHNCEQVQTAFKY
ncbi:2 iron, 2 sulfur cluster binding [Sparganum proliferum]